MGCYCNRKICHSYIFILLHFRTIKSCYTPSRFFQMKRARVDEDFNPVYPYDSPNAPIMPFITPPFTSSDGLQEKPLGVLSLNYKDPVTTQNGSLTLKLGSGLNINDQGQLTSTAGEVEPPLTNNNNKLALAYSQPLAVENNRLIVSYNAPLAVTGNSLGLQVSEPIFINDNDKLALQTAAPLKTNAGTLRLQSAAPLGLAEETLKLLFSKPLYLQGDFLSLGIERPLAIAAAGTLALQLTPPLTTNDSGLTISTADPVTVSNGNLGLRISRPLVVQNNSLSLALTPPLRLFNSEPVLGLGFTFPITVVDNLLSLNIGNGLTLLYNKLTANLGRDLQFQNGAIAVSLTTEPPLQYTTKLQLNVGAGLRYNGASRKLDVDINQQKGLTWENNAVVPKLGQGLYFDPQGNIAMSPTNVKPDTLWTTADPSPNCSVYTDLDAKLWLSLVKCGGMVQGSIALQAQKGTLMSVTEPSVTIILHFNDNGVRINYPTLDNQGTLGRDSTWGYRQGQSANTNVTNAVEFMPNSSRYPRGRGEQAQNQTVGYTCLQGNLSMPIFFQVQYNYVTTGYSFKFTWQAVQRQKFDIPCCSFSYITEE
ncbi:long fiber [Rhesus adenovirus 65]|nr:long fiber [Rhesus adenovirus 65]